MTNRSISFAIKNKPINLVPFIITSLGNSSDNFLKIDLLFEDPSRISIT